MRAVWRAARYAVRRRRLQTLIIGVVVLLSTATTVLAMGLLATVDGPYDRAFAQQRGAHLTVSYDAARTTGAQAAASAARPGVTAAGGPYASQIMTVGSPGRPAGGSSGGSPGGPSVRPALPPGPITVVARAADGGDRVDRLTLKRGRWATGPGEIVVGSDLARGPGQTELIGQKVPFTDGRTLTIVGLGRSITRSAQGWVAPGQLTRPDGRQMLYRLADPAAPAANVTAGLAATSAQSYEVARRKATEDGKVAIPFLVAFGVAGLIVAVLIIGNVVSGAVVSGFRHIGVLKAIGFTPAQVTGVYLMMIAVPAVVGCLAGTVAGNILAGAVSASLSESLDLPAASGVSVAVDVLAVLGVLGVAAVTALVPAVRAGLVPAAVAVSAGAAPRRGRALRVQRLLARTRLPRPVSLGLGVPFARPGRTALTVSAVAFGVAAVTLAVGLSRTLDAYFTDETRLRTFQVEVVGQGEAPSLAGRPGTAKVAVTSSAQVHVPGSSRAVELKAYQGAPADRHGYRVVSGRWLDGPGQVVVGDPFLEESGKRIGDTVTVGTDGRKAVLRIVGTAIVDGSDTFVTDWASFAPFGDVALGSLMEVTLTPGTSARAYVDALTAEGVMAHTTDEGTDVEQAIVLGLVALLTLGIAAVAGLGVFNTVVLNTRDRVRDFGILKSLGATPKQVLTVVLVSMGALGLLGGLIGLPLGMAAHQVVLPAMARTGGIVLPYGLTEIFPWTLAALFVLAGIAIAVLGALVPAGWAARIRTATALRSE
ncbi:ABC transporter permease [Spirillospora albida]|uniref:ABC transporter permease n=1 Tax=Spirillospora albida TaxID=58123 RepID=UPI0004C28129|nr:ABC transporter permease [Spirillospora albida]